MIINIGTGQAIFKRILFLVSLLIFKLANLSLLKVISINTVAGLSRYTMFKGSVVISGISGAYPSCDNIDELAEKLYAKVDLMTDDDSRWKDVYPGVPHRIGKIKDLSKFDATFFGVNPKVASSMSPAHRILMEKVFEAIVDAGINPKTLKGTKTAVFIGTTVLRDMSAFEGDGRAFIGMAKFNYSNLISYCFDLKGPSCTFDCACSSSLFALSVAYKSIKDGECDAAIVGGMSLCTDVDVSAAYANMTVLSQEGCCKTFDESADGFARSEAVCAILLQKEEDAHRIYSRIIHIKCNNDGFKNEGTLFPSMEMQRDLIRELFEECKVNPNDVAWVECHGTGTRVGDPVELEAISAIYCQSRKSPLLIGSVKSNLGHTEPPSGLVGISKVVIAMENGIIPPNIHFKRPNPAIKSLIDGKTKVISDPTPWKGGLVGLSGFGIGGTNAHVLLESHKKCKELATLGNFPRLLPFSGRTKVAVHNAISTLGARELDPELVRLIQEVHKDDVQGHLYRGYVLLGSNENNTKHVQRYEEQKRPIWFIYSGMGSQWPGMASSLMKIPVFANSIKQSHDILQPFGIDLIKCVTCVNDTSVLTDILISFVCIVAIQIAISDVLKLLDITPDGILGHSTGEMASGYMDGCLSHKQALLSAYYRGRTANETELIEGAMASVGMEYSKLKNILPKEVEIACRNSSENCTISGPSKIVNEVIKTLESNGTFVRRVQTADIAFHSSYINSMKPISLSYLEKIIQEPKRRSSKWISTSVPQDKWDTDLAKYCSAAYIVNNLSSMVNFEEGMNFIPSNAITVEVAPHGLMQAILKKSLNTNVINIPLANRRSADNLEFFLSSIGRLYENGLQPQIHKLYPAIDFPVSRGTRAISPLIEWDHGVDWFVQKYDPSSDGVRHLKISLRDDRYKFMEGHVLNGHNLFPAVGYLWHVWEAFAQMEGSHSFQDISVVFEDISFLRAINLPEQDYVTFTITIQKGSGTFQITDDKSPYVTGIIRKLEDNEKEIELEGEFVENDDVDSSQYLKKDEIYKELKLSGYQYKKLFQGLIESNITGTKGLVEWHENYVTFIDSMMQIKIISSDLRSMLIPVKMQKVIIDTKKQKQVVQQTKEKGQKGIPVYYDKQTDLIQSGGVSITKMDTRRITTRKSTKDPVVKKLVFMPFINHKESLLQDAIEMCVLTIVESVSTRYLSILEVLNADNNGRNIISTRIVKVLDTYPGYEPVVKIFGARGALNIDRMDVTVSTSQCNESNYNSLIVILHRVLNNPKSFQDVAKHTPENGYVICIERKDQELPSYDLDHLDMICSLDYVTDDCRFFLLRKNQKMMDNILVKIELNDYEWIRKLQNIVSELKTKNSDSRIIIYSEKEPLSGIMGFYHSLRKEYMSLKIRAFFMVDCDVPDFSPADDFYKEQISKDYPMNIFKNGKWGDYCYISINNSLTAKNEYGFVNCHTYGDMSSILWFEGPIDPYRYLADRKDLKVNVCYAPLNFHDLMLASGKLAPDVEGRLKQDYLIGSEFCGYGEDGKRYMGMVPNSGIATKVIANNHFTWIVPENWSLEDASTVPVVYATALYALIIRGHVTGGESILIHSGTGGVGQAAINIALHFGCNIFVTVGTEEKRKFLRQHFPQIPESHIGDSRNSNFEGMVMKETNNKGVDIILNSLSEEKLQKSFRCLAKYGKFLEIGKYDLQQDNKLGMKPFLEGVSFHGVMLDNLLHFENSELPLVAHEVQKGIDEGYVKPLARTVFSRDQVQEAFRYMSTGEHIGKIVIKIQEESTAKGSGILVDVIPQYLCYANRSYIICGGLGGMGLELSDWLVTRGARNIIISSRSGMKTGYQAFRTRIWKSYGVNVVVRADDISTEEGVENLLMAANSIAPVYAIFNLAVIITDDLFEKQTERNFIEASKPKYQASYYLDKVSRRLCPNLEQFVVFSSICAGFGNKRQVSYGWANSVMEKICEKRKSDNLPALAIQYGAIGHVGILAEAYRGDDRLAFGGTMQQSIASVLEGLHFMLNQDDTIVTSYLVNRKTESKVTRETPYDKVLNTLDIKDTNSLSMNMTLAEWGIDSLMIVTVKQLLQNDYGTTLSTKEIRNLTFSKLMKLSDEKMIATEKIKKQ